MYNQLVEYLFTHDIVDKTHMINSLVKDQTDLDGVQRRGIIYRGMEFISYESDLNTDVVKVHPSLTGKAEKLYTFTKEISRTLAYIENYLRGVINRSKDLEAAALMLPQNLLNDAKIFRYDNPTAIPFTPQQCEAYRQTNKKAYDLLVLQAMRAGVLS